MPVGPRRPVAAPLALPLTVAGLVAFLLLGALPSRAEDGDLEAKVKAAFILNFLTFVDWQASRGGAAPGAADAPMRICVLGRDPVLPLLQGLTSRPVKGRRLEVAGVSKVAEALPCHLLVIARSEADRLPEHLRPLAGAGVLTVSDIPRFARQGGMIGFVTEGGRVRIEINQRVVAGAGLRIRAKLLEVARLVS